jgi:hypothetical protein
MDGKRKGFLVALVIGLVASPALALVASGLLGGEAVADEPATTTAAAPALGTAPPPSTTTTASPANLETACTVEGWALVVREAAGGLSDLQQAALDALRPICEAEGFSLKAIPVAGMAAPTTSAAAPAVTTTAPQAQYDGGGQSWYGDDEGEGDDEGGD